MLLAPAHRVPRPAAVSVPPDLFADTAVDLLATCFAAGSRAPDTPAAAPPPIAPGAVIGNYRVVELLATGGMGEVFVGEHVHLPRRVAIKVLHRRLLGDRDALARFTAEAYATARVRHPGVVSLFDYGPTDGGAYLVMELLSGETLSDRLARDGRLPVPVVLDLGAQLADALGAAHRAGVVHRDLKPDNIFLVPAPGRPAGSRAVLLDFGVAKVEAALPVPTATANGDLLGTPLYMAPEQSLRPGAVDHRSDIYALGCVLYRLLAGDVPFRGSLMQILLGHQNTPPVPPGALASAVPRALDQLVLHMLAKAPADRPQTTAEVARALRAIALTTAPTGRRLARLFGRRAPW